MQQNEDGGADGQAVDEVNLLYLAYFIFHTICTCLSVIQIFMVELPLYLYIYNVF